VPVSGRETEKGSLEERRKRWNGKRKREERKRNGLWGPLSVETKEEREWRGM